MHFYLRTTPNSETTVIISVSKKVSKKAVVRNLIKRRVRAIIRNLKKELKPMTYMIIAKPEAELVKGKALETELRSLVVSCRL